MKTLDLNECAEFLKCDRSTALELAGSGQIVGTKIGRGWVFLEDELIEFLRTRARTESAQRLAAARVDERLAAAAVRHDAEAPGGKRRRGRRDPLPPLPDVSAEEPAPSPRKRPKSNKT